MTLQLRQVGRFLDDDGFVPVLEEMAVPLVPAIEGPCVASQQGAHRPREGPLPRPDEQVHVIGEHRPRVDGPRPGRGEGRQSGDELAAIPVIAEDRPALDAPHHHVVQDTRGIEAGTAGHGGSLPWGSSGVKDTEKTAGSPFRP